MNTHSLLFLNIGGPELIIVLVLALIGLICILRFIIKWDNLPGKKIQIVLVPLVSLVPVYGRVGQAGQDTQAIRIPSINSLY